MDEGRASGRACAGRASKQHGKHGTGRGAMGGGADLHRPPNTMTKMMRATTKPTAGVRMRLVQGRCVGSRTEQQRAGWRIGGAE